MLSRRHNQLDHRNLHQRFQLCREAHASVLLPRGFRLKYIKKVIYKFLGFCLFLLFFCRNAYFFSMAREKEKTIRLASLFSLPSFCCRRRRCRHFFSSVFGTSFDAHRTGWRRGRRRLLHRPPTERARIDPLRSQETTIGIIIQKKKMSKTSSRGRKNKSRPF